MVFIFLTEIISSSSLPVRYYGGIKEGKQHGWGTYTSTTGTYKKKEGEWAKGDMVKGTLTFKDDEVYEGEFQTDENGDDQPWGRGKWTFKKETDGRRDYYEGQFKNGMSHGKGKLVQFKKGGKIQVTEGRWEDDNYLGV